MKGAYVMQVLLINGSPHEHGCTFTALSEVAKVLEEQGIDTKIVSIGKAAIRGCIGCGGCRKAGKCVFDEDIVNQIAAEAKVSDGFAFGSPVYYASANGSLFSLLDRLFFSQSDALRHKPAAAVVSARRGGTTTALHDIENYITYNQMPLVSSTYWNMVHGSNAEQVALDEEGLQTMRNLGRNMAWILQCIEAGKKVGITPPEAETALRTNFIR